MPETFGLFGYKTETDFPDFKNKVFKKLILDFRLVQKVKKCYADFNRFSVLWKLRLFQVLQATRKSFPQKPKITLAEMQ